MLIVPRCIDDGGSFVLLYKYLLLLASAFLWSDIPPLQRRIFSTGSFARFKFYRLHLQSIYIRTNTRRLGSVAADATSASSIITDY